MELAKCIQTLPLPVAKDILDRCSPEELAAWRKTSDIAKKIVDDYLPFSRSNKCQNFLSRVLQFLTLEENPQTKRFKEWSEGGMVDKGSYEGNLPIEGLPLFVKRLSVDTRDQLLKDRVNALCLLSDEELLVGTLGGDIFRVVKQKKTCILELHGGNELHSSAINDIIQLREGLFACAIVGDETYFTKGGITLFTLTGKVLGHFQTPMMLDYLQVGSQNTIYGISKASKAVGKWRIGAKYLEGHDLAEGGYPDHCPVYVLDSVKKTQEVHRQIDRANQEYLTRYR